MRFTFNTFFALCNEDIFPLISHEYYGASLRSPCKYLALIKYSCRVFHKESSLRARQLISVEYRVVSGRAARRRRLSLRVSLCARRRAAWRVVCRRRCRAAEPLVFCFVGCFGVASKGEGWRRVSCSRLIGVPLRRRRQPKGRPVHWTAALHPRQIKLWTSRSGLLHSGELFTCMVM